MAVWEQEIWFIGGDDPDSEGIASHPAKMLTKKGDGPALVARLGGPHDLDVVALPAMTDHSYPSAAGATQAVQVRGRQPESGVPQQRPP
jgi:hypothetical protein